MRIDAINKMYETYKTNGIASSSKVNKTSSKDEVALSNTAKDFRAAYKALANVPDVRQDKVDEIKEQMNNNSYNVKASAVAEKILSKYNVRG
ncbi:flagellar biosynthesis anti-sigma factor FlgM [Cellulosilyticum ruminicola]|uniref:flagellar biosynthesis anti-sigma factor FlgM n=1 Tax=Cellulosilyticum ruminicola TaxID=425254 RepID=UPI0006D1789E|nr:flagellar biosynthesis anti-sigma factor FlgM [Cellulosilyticum ruminicola]